MNFKYPKKITDQTTTDDISKESKLKRGLFETVGGHKFLRLLHVGGLSVVLRHALVGAPRVPLGLALEVQHAGPLCNRGQGLISK